MNAERLHAIARSLKDEIQETATHLSELTQALKRQQGNSADPNTQRQVAGDRKKLVDFLATSKTNSFSPAWRESLATCGIASLLGNELSNTIEGIFARHQITPAAAYDEMKIISERANDFETATDGMLLGFQFYGIGTEQLQPGECEWGFLIPRAAVNNHLEALGEEFKDLNRILNPFLELTIKGRPPIQVRSITASEFGLYLVGIPAACAAFAKAMQFVIETYKSLLEIRDLRSRLVQQGYGKGELQAIDDKANGKMQAAIQVTVKELVKEYGDHIDTGRKREVTKELTISLHAIANRIDKGYNIEVRANPPAVTQTESESDSDEDETSRAEYFDTINAAQKILQFIHQEGVPMLTLPADLDDLPSTTTEPADANRVKHPGKKTAKSAGVKAKTKGGVKRAKRKPAG